MPTSFMTGLIVGKRFYKKVMTREADDGNVWTVMLDYRTLKRPSKRPLKLPSLIDSCLHYGDGGDEEDAKLEEFSGGEASASFVNSGGTRAIVEILGAFLETLIKETGCEVSSMKLLYMHLSDRKPVEKEDEIIVMVVPDYKMLKYVEKIAKDLQMTR
ncbi:unnamed protein product [Brassica oleracea var. botrytis]|uniref:Uncharacterized protein n=1 Tax=Brassica oleracea TaxID=3712 RepID=A0A3P6E9K5_BRAOL|nr:unnamed protein product [Brassica oleracea]